VSRPELLKLRGGYEGNPIIGQGISAALKNGQALNSILSRHLSRSKVATIPDFLSYAVVQLDGERWKRYRANGSQTAMMAVMPTAKLVVVNDDSLSYQALSDQLDIRILTLHSFVHEAMHSIAPRNRAIKYLQKENGVLHETQGVRHTITDVSDAILAKAEGRARTASIFLVFLDEAINDELAEEVVRELCSESGLHPKAALDSFYEKWRERGTFHGESRRLLSCITRSMAERTGLSSETILRSFQRAELEGRNLFVGESDIPSMDEVMGYGFTVDLSRISDKLSIDAFVSKYKLEP